MLHYSGSVSVRWSHCAACVHACTLAFVCATASIRDCLVQLPVVPSSKRLCCAPLLFLLFSTGVGKKTPSSLSLCSGSWEKKSLSDVAACSHSQNPSSSFSPSLILSSLPLRPNCSQTNTHTHSYHVIHLLHHDWCL